MTEHHVGTLTLSGIGNADAPQDETQIFQDPEPDLGRHAYEAYCSATGWKSAVSGVPLPYWEQQTDQIRGAWTQAAEAVKRVILD